MVGENTPGYGYFLDEQDKAAGKDVPPLEPMAQAMKRLRREKRWKEFCKLRADYKRKHHLEAEEAFYKALSFFPPLLLPQPDKPEVLSNRQVTEQERTWKKKHEEQIERKVRKKLDKAEKERKATEEGVAAQKAAAELEALAERSSDSSFAADFEWAYENIGNSSVKASDAPSGGAWFMLEYGREARAKFVDMALRYFSKAGKEADETRIFADDHRKKLAVCDKLLAFQGGVAPRPAWERRPDPLS